MNRTYGCSLEAASVLVVLDEGGTHSGGDDFDMGDERTVTGPPDHARARDRNRGDAFAPASPLPLSAMGQAAGTKQTLPQSASACGRHSPRSVQRTAPARRSRPAQDETDAQLSVGGA